jgi:hypothetical protein
LHHTKTLPGSVRDYLPWRNTLGPFSPFLRSNLRHIPSCPIKLGNGGITAFKILHTECIPSVISLLTSSICAILSTTCASDFSTHSFFKICRLTLYLSKGLIASVRVVRSHLVELKMRILFDITQVPTESPYSLRCATHCLSEGWGIL